MIERTYVHDTDNIDYTVYQRRVSYQLRSPRCMIPSGYLQNSQYTNDKIRYPEFFVHSRSEDFCSQSIRNLSKSDATQSLIANNRLHADFNPQSFSRNVRNTASRNLSDDVGGHSGSKFGRRPRVYGRYLVVRTGSTAYCMCCRRSRRVTGLSSVLSHFCIFSESF